MDGNILVNNIRYLCKKKKISITKLENDLFLSSGLISRWSKNVPALDKIVEIAKYLNVSIDELVGYSKTSLEQVDIGRLLSHLYKRTLYAEINWEIFNFQNPPEKLTNIKPLDFFPCNSCDCYFTGYNDGFFFLASTYTPFRELQLGLFILPDTYSALQCACSNNGELQELYEYLSRRHAQRMNQIKSINFVNAFLEDSAKEDTSEEDSIGNSKITTLKSIGGASNF